MQHNVHLESDHHAIAQRLLLSEGPAVDRVVIDDTRFLFTAHFQKSGPDLVLTDGDVRSSSLLITSISTSIPISFHQTAPSLRPS